MQMMQADSPSVPIIQHPDVRRMLISMKAYVEGMRSLLYYVGILTDRLGLAEDEKEKKTLQGMIDLLIPICKGYVTDRAYEVCNNGMQVFGGYGYIKEYPQEQLVRDCRITMIYEGTNGIQAMDLLGRKLGLNGGKTIMNLMAEIQATIARAKEQENLGGLADRLGTTLNRLAEVAMHLGANAMSPQVLNAFAFAYPFMEVSGDVVMGWMLLWRAAVAAEKLQASAKHRDRQPPQRRATAAEKLQAGGKAKDKKFYEGVIKSAEYFIQCVLPVTMGKMEAIMLSAPAAVEIEEDSFGGK